MAIGTGILLFAVGAILRFAVYYSVRGVAIGTVGIILMLVGAVGVIIGLMLRSPWAQRSRTSHRVVDEVGGAPTAVREETIEHETPPAVGRY